MIQEARLQKATTSNSGHRGVHGGGHPASHRRYMYAMYIPSLGPFLVIKQEALGNCNMLSVQSEEKASVLHKGGSSLL